MLGYSARMSHALLDYDRLFSKVLVPVTPTLAVIVGFICSRSDQHLALSGFDILANLTSAK